MANGARTKLHPTKRILGPAREKIVKLLKIPEVETIDIMGNLNRKIEIEMGHEVSK